MVIPRAWCFLHPYFDASELPGLKISVSGGIRMVEGDAALRQSLLMLITTAPGERLMRPEYGCDLGRLMFMPNDATTHGLAIHYIRLAIERWEPRVEIVQLDANADPVDQGRMLISLEYRARATLQIDQLSYSMSLA